ncbi:MAG: hypothetical protein AAF959_21110 [Cyanobacteria bacterium P01_D01_bin.56]
MLHLENPITNDRGLRQIVKYLPWLAFGGIAYWRLITPPIALGICLLGVGWLLYQRNAKMQRIVDKIGQRRYFRVLAGLLFGIALWISQTNPVFAQFFQGAEDFFNTTFPGTDTVTPIVFGVIRAIFLIYIAVSLVRVIQAGRNDDDWQQMARAPVIIVLAVILGDVLTGLVVGTGAGP